MTSRTRRTRPKGPPVAPDVLVLVALAREGLTLEEIGARVGRHRSRVSQILLRHGYRIADLRDIRCASCNARMGKASRDAGPHAPRSLLHYCADPRCRPAYRRDVRRRDRERLERLGRLEGWRTGR